MAITETLIMVITTTIIVATSNLALGVLGGATAACVVFVRELVSAVRVEVKTSSDGATVRHDVHGALFFASTGRLIDALATNGPERAIQIDLSKIHMWDASAILAVEEALDRHRADGIDVKLTGLDGASEALHRRIVGRTADAVGNPPAS